MKQLYGVSFNSLWYLFWWLILCFWLVDHLEIFPTTKIKQRVLNIIYAIDTVCLISICLINNI